MMQVYHGSYTKIERVDLTLSLPYKDFGQGFYVTKFRQHAEDWARRKGRRKHTQGVVTEFNFINGTFAERICKIKHFDGYTEEWLDFVVLNRNNALSVPTHDYDIVEGPIADDDITNRIFDYVNGLVSKEEFLKELIYHEETHQICFCTVASLQTLEGTNKDSNKFASHVMHISESVLKALVIDSKLGAMEAADLFYNSNTFTQLADISNALYKKTGMEIYEMLKQELTISS
jgi:hypothetical protein